MKEHLTPFGLWLWNRLPVLRRDNLFSGYGVRGIYRRDGLPYVACYVDAYTHFWPQMKFFPKWRLVYLVPIIGRISFEVETRHGKRSRRAR